MYVKNIALLTLVLLLGCSDDGLPSGTDEPCDCPPPVNVNNGLGPRLPALVHGYTRISPDGAKLIYSNVLAPQTFVLNLESNEVTNLLSILATHGVKDICESEAWWCPYDNNRVLLRCVTGACDEQNLYIISLDGSEFKRITPNFPDGKKLFYAQVYAWLSGSTRERDSIAGYFQPLDFDSDGATRLDSIYIPQTGEYAPIPSSGAILAENKHSGVLSSTRSSSIPLFLNNEQINFNDLSTVTYAGWQPSGESFVMAASGTFVDNERECGSWPVVLLVDIEGFLQSGNVKTTIINLQSSFCMYSIGGLFPTFVSDSTLAVSMHKDGDDFSPLWEITFDGRMVRQLTFPE